jgi:hypothetical protein
MILLGAPTIPGLEVLLDLHGSIIDQEGGYWVAIEAWHVETSRHIPHGVRYSLTLHEPYGRRILGYDNAHAASLPKKFKFAGRRLPFDHKHRHASDRGVPYEFQSAYQLLQDFFHDVDEVLREVKKP